MNNLGGNVENMKELGELIRQLPNVQSFRSDLSVNDLGVNSENLSWLGKGMKKLPNNLRNFELGLWNNNLGKNVDNMKGFVLDLKYIP